MVAICDVDDIKLEDASKLFPEAKKYNDFRKMLEEMGDQIDAVTVSTPDHCHAAASAMAMKMGKHCFCQKPLTHTIYEARALGRRQGQGVRPRWATRARPKAACARAAAILRGGALGDIREVHVWTNRPIWKQGVDRPEAEAAAGKSRLGPLARPGPEAALRRGRLSPVLVARLVGFRHRRPGRHGLPHLRHALLGLDLRDPLSVQAVTSGHNKDSYPQWSMITYEFPENDQRPALKVMWYDGGKRPDEKVMEGKIASASGCMLVGAKGKLFSPNDYGAQFEMLGVEKPKVEFEVSPGHFEEWIEAIKGQRERPGRTSPTTPARLPKPSSSAISPSGSPTRARARRSSGTPRTSRSENVQGLEGIVKPTYGEGYEQSAGQVLLP